MDTCNTLWGDGVRVCVCVGGGWLFLLLLLLLLTNVLLLVSIQDAALHLMVATSFRYQPSNDNKDSVHSIVPTCWRETLSQCTSRVGMRCMWTMQWRGQTPGASLSAWAEGYSDKTEWWHPITGVRAAAARCSTRFKRWSLAAFQTSCLTNDMGQKGKSTNTELLANTASGRPGIRRRRSRGNQNNKGERKRTEGARLMSSRSTEDTFVKKSR